jgi:hypothetical protein
MVLLVISRLDFSLGSGFQLGQGQQGWTLSALAFLVVSGIYLEVHRWRVHLSQASRACLLDPAAYCFLALLYVCET